MGSKRKEAAASYEKGRRRPGKVVTRSHALFGSDGHGACPDDRVLATCVQHARRARGGPEERRKAPDFVQP